ncbi:hypothetical protein F8388_018805 [Cannabis sativa]|uniref:DUF4283 domain-containing protein n=1 Tax=Cannabis sativa TaxID=3483 RepID=A0A7J6I7L1_CANSA|nr:hypothetical protein F8388_018805 [Cannabis sativa]KAF4403594.1 hypothetical protein G4B88_002447 [Cannabis sativa]
MALVNATKPGSKGKCISIVDASVALVPCASTVKALSSFCLYGKLVAHMFAEGSKVQEYLLKTWERPVTVGALEGSKNLNCFVFSFKNAEDSQWALDNAPWCVQGYTLVFSSWTPRVGNEFSISSLQVWVQFYLLPREYFSGANGELLGPRAVKRKGNQQIWIPKASDTGRELSLPEKGKGVVSGLTEGGKASVAFSCLRDADVDFSNKKKMALVSLSGAVGKDVGSALGKCGPDFAEAGGEGVLSVIEAIGPAGYKSNSRCKKVVGPGLVHFGDACVGNGLAIGPGSSSINGQETNVICDEGRALSNFFQAQDTFLQELKMFGNLDLFEMKNLGGDIGVKTSSEQNERTTPIK